MGDTMIKEKPRLMGVYQLYKKTFGFGIYVGWDKHPCVLLISVGMWVVVLGPHTHSEPKEPSCQN